MSDIGEAGPQPVDRKELLAEQFDAVETAQDNPQPEKYAAPATGERARDESGKFVNKQVTGGNIILDDKASPFAKAQGDQMSAPEPKPWEAPPASWKKDKHALWQGMSPEQQEYAFQREEQMRSGVEPLLPKAELADKISKVSEPYMNTIRGLGMDLPGAVEGLMRVDHQLRTLPFDQRLQQFLNIGKGYGIDLTGQAQNATPGYDPNVQALQNELLSIKGQFSNFTQQQEAAQQNVALSEIQSFARTAEHFDEVKPVMAKLLESGMAENLSDAYDKALRLNPDLFNSIQSAQQAANGAEKRATADAAAKRARAAVVSMRSATPGAPKAPAAKDRRSMLSEALDGIEERF